MFLHYSEEFRVFFTPTESDFGLGCKIFKALSRALMLKQYQNLDKKKKKKILKKKRRNGGGK